MKSGNPNFLEPSGPLQACNETALHLPLLNNTNLTFYLLELLTLFLFGCRRTEISTRIFRIDLRMFLSFSSREMTTTPFHALSDLSFTFHRKIIFHLNETFEIKIEWMKIHKAHILTLVSEFRLTSLWPKTYFNICLRIFSVMRLTIMLFIAKVSGSIFINRPIEVTDVFVYCRK